MKLLAWLCIVAGGLLSVALAASRKAISVVPAPVDEESPALSGFVDQTAGKVFSPGPYKVTCVIVRKKLLPFTNIRPPKPLRIWVPLLSRSSSSTSLPVVVFQHGFASQNWFYSQLLTRIASHGFIVAAPQMYRRTAGANTTSEMTSSAASISWLHSHLSALLSLRPSTLRATPDWSKFILTGHSRGGKIAFGVALSLATPLPVPIRALIGMDPVDGYMNMSTPPAVIRNNPHSVNASVPVLVIAAGYGPYNTDGTMGDGGCAPYYVGPNLFFSDAAGPALFFNVSEYGHADFCNDRLAKAGKRLCLAGAGPPSAMRATAAGLFLAFTSAALKGNFSDITAVYANPGLSPAVLAAPRSYPSPPPWG